MQLDPDWPFLYMKEVWKAVRMDARYEVSNRGRIRRIETKEIINGYFRFGYRRLYIGNKMIDLHRIVALTFLPNPENKATVNHKDADKKNNYVSNLEWATDEENQIHSIKNRLHKYGEKHWNCKLTTKQVLRIKKFHRSDRSGVSVAKQFSVDKGTIYDIWNRRTWNHI